MWRLNNILIQYVLCAIDVESGTYHSLYLFSESDILHIKREFLSSAEQQPMSISVHDCMKLDFAHEKKHTSLGFNPY